MTNKIGLSFCCYVLFPLLVSLNRALLQVTTPIVITARIGLLLLGIVLIFFSASRKGNSMLPILGLIPYLILEACSSATGYCPNVSYLKLINFVVFIAGLSYGARNLEYRADELYRIRLFFLSMSFFIICGSLLTLPFPAIAYPVNASLVMNELGMQGTTSYLKTQYQGMFLFGGVMNQSQALAPIVSLVISYVLSDMLFIEKRISRFHMVLIVGGVVCSFLTRSRTGLLSLAMAFGVNVLFAFNRVSMPIVVRRRVRNMIQIGVFVSLVFGIVAEIHNRTFSRWIFKTDDIASDSRSAIDAVTETRQMAIDELMTDFRRNPIWGCGFQVNEESARFANAGFVMSAPVEKGLLPLMVLGEGGVVGAILFTAFLVSFYGICIRKRYYVTVVTFSTFLATNIGEATFFSPGGIGGILWMYGALGGFTLDLLVKWSETMYYWRS